MHKQICVLAVFLLTVGPPGMALRAQDIPMDKYAGAVPAAGALKKIGKEYGDLEKKLTNQSLDILDRMEKKEMRLRSKISLKDSAAAQQLFGDVHAKYERLASKLKAPIDGIVPRPLQEYIPRLDSFQTASKFLGGSTVPGMPVEQLQALSGQLKQLQGRMGQAGEVREFLQQREQLLKDQLARYNPAKYLTSVNKEVYYFQQRLAEYKDILNNSSKMEEVVLGYVRKLPVFESFMQKNSYLGQLFPMPQNYGTQASLAGVPTNADVGNTIAQKIGNAGTNMDANAYLRGQAQAGEQQMGALREKVMHAGVGNSTEEMPQFTPNQQKTRSFLKRIELGFNVQSQQSTSLLPVSTDLTFTAGYKFSDRIVSGIGVAYKLGWGKEWRHLSMSSQGIGLRSYFDWKAKGSFWLTGGFEYNYMTEFSKLSDLRDLDVWQKSALIGISNKYKVGRRNGYVQLLYDVLASSERPRPSSIKFRVGYTF